METKLARFLIIIALIGALYVAVQSIIWTITFDFPVSVVLYVAAIMLLFLVFVGFVAKKVWEDIRKYDGE